MKHWSGYNFFALVLTIFVTIGLNLSVVQAGNMAVKMSIVTDMDGMKSDGCGGCPGGDDAVPADCASGCMVTASAMLPAPATVDSSVLPRRFEIIASAPRDGPYSADFTPPKS